MNQLHPIAQAVQSQGRGRDTQLVHMTPNEVAGLQALAMAHGGSLSINPNTGLPEAGFLESLLPTIAGFALNAMAPGLGTLGSAALVGLGATALNKGDLGKGLMAGLGAWGGAGLSQNFLTAGAAGAAAPQIGNQAIQAANAGAQSVMNPAMTSTSSYGFGQAMPTATGVSAGQVGATNQFLSSAGAQVAPAASAPLAPMPQMSVPPPTTMDTLGAGIKSAMNAPDQFLKNNWKSVAAAAAPVAMMPPEGANVPSDNEQFQYDYDPGRVSEEDLARQRRENPDGELVYFRPKYGPRRTVRVAQGGELRYADGGSYGYEYDPVTQTYKKVEKAPTAPEGAVTPIGIDGGNSDNGPQLSKGQIDFLDKETPAERDARMGKINDVLSMLAPGAIARGIVGGLNSVTGGSTGQTPAPVFSVNVSGDRGGVVSSSTDNMGSVTADPTGAGETYGDVSEGTLFAQGGLAGLATGGMSKGGFVVPADVVSALGNGSTDAGLRTLQAKMGAVKPIKGQGDGLSDSIKTSIDGKQPARVADGEAYIPPETVAKIGGGDPKKGAKKLYAMMDKIRQQAHGKKSQQRRVNPNTAV